MAGPGTILPASSLPPGTRPIRTGDEAQILEAALAIHARGELEGVSRHALEDAVARLASEPWAGAIAEDDGVVAGWVVPDRDDLTVALPFRRHGHGRRLVEAGRVVAAHLGLAHLRVWVPRRSGPEAFARACGLRYHSSLWRLRLDPASAAREPVFPSDMVVRPFEPGADEAGYVALINDTFVDHPSPLVVDEGTVRRVHGDPSFDPSTILLVERADARGVLVGFCRVARAADDDGALAGDVKLLGVRREARGRGLGRALVRWGIDDLRRRGVDRTFISVEGENEAALRIYEDEGFRRDVEWPHWIAPPVTG